jgi:biotin synthase-like enzyme
MEALNLDDYYFENGLMVFTTKYHLKRGFCCKNNCRHCPFSKQVKTETRNSQK